MSFLNHVGRRLTPFSQPEVKNKAANAAQEATPRESTDAEINAQLEALLSRVEQHTGGFFAQVAPEDPSF